ncbi:hypothetical protein ACHAW6_014944 [Cyclotella cf. meneghiniana]
MALKRILLIISILHADSFHANHRFPGQSSRPRHLSQIQRHETHDNDRRDNSYESSASSIKAIVSSLTSISNFFSLSSQQQQRQTPSFETRISAAPSRTPPNTSAELLERIREDYARNNYLWTGKLDTSSFTQNCKFTDPTISFEGVDKYVRNVENLVPVVDFLLGKEPTSKSELLEIRSNKEEGYIETRWNMVGELNILPWKPRIDVIGRTKFWYQTSKDGKGGKDAVRVYLYDETWEIPAGLALLQLVTPAGTIANSTIAN